LRYALAVYVVARLLTSALAAMVASARPIHTVWETDPGFLAIRQAAYAHGNRLADLLLGVWFRWDTGWYMRIAIEGYSTTAKSVIFPPLYPLLVRLLGQLLGGEYLLAGLIISNVSYLAALYLLHDMLSTEFSTHEARRSIELIAVFPAAFYYLAAYSESLFLLLSLLTFCAARRSKWLLAGVAAFLATLTRLTGAVLCLPVLLEALHANGWMPLSAHPKTWVRQGLLAWRGMLAAASGPLALLAYDGYLCAAGLPSVNDAFAGLWNVGISWPWHSVVEAVRALSSGQGSLMQGLNLATLLLFLCLTAASTRLVQPSWWVYALISQLFFLLRDYPVRQLDGSVRYLAVLFPCFVTLALCIRNRWLRAGLTVLFGLVQAVLIGMFVRWLWVA
jgi:hypothetical protein